MVELLLPIRAEIGMASVLGYLLWKPGKTLEMLEDFSDGTAGMDHERNKRLDSLWMGSSSFQVSLFL